MISFRPAAVICIFVLFSGLLITTQYSDNFLAVAKSFSGYNSFIHRQTQVVSDSSTIVCPLSCICEKNAACISCISNNASLVQNSSTLLYECDCDLGFYGIPPLNSTNSCISCNSSCKSCNQTDLCLTCFDPNASPINSFSKCTCNDGYYGTPSLTNSSLGCRKCPADCKTCNSKGCVSCISLNAYVNSTGQCVCDSKYYNLTALNSSDSCTLVSSDCLDFDPNTGMCKSCVSTNAEPNINKTCSCRPGF